MHRNLVYEKPEVAFFVATYIMKTGNMREGVKAFWTLARRQDTAIQGFLGLIRFFPPNTSASELLPVYSEMLEAFPSIREVRLDYAYLCLLADNNIPEAAEAARGLLLEDPNSLAALSVAALGYYKNGEISQAATLYDGKKILWKGAPTPWRVVRVTILAALGRKKEAEELAATIDLSKLRPEERQLLEQQNPKETTGRPRNRQTCQPDDPTSGQGRQCPDLATPASSEAVSRGSRSGRTAPAPSQLRAFRSRGSDLRFRWRRRQHERR
jgi:hypothetical protein